MNFVIYLDTLEKVNRNVLNLKYDIKSLHEKIDKLEELITTTVMVNRSGVNENNSFDDTDQFQNIVNNTFPLENTGALQHFESQLQDTTFKTKMVSIICKTRLAI